jgi:hypothetical protein
MLQTEIDWPGIPEEFAKPFTNIDYQEDLFTWAKLANLDIDFEGDDDEEVLIEETPDE